MISPRKRRTSPAKMFHRPPELSHIFTRGSSSIQNSAHMRRRALCIFGAGVPPPFLRRDEITKTSGGTPAPPGAGTTEGFRLISSRRTDRTKMDYFSSAVSDIGDADNCFHGVLLAGREFHGKFVDVTGFDADDLNPFVIAEIRQGMRFPHPGIPHHRRA